MLGAMNDVPHEPEDSGFSRNANGPAETSGQGRHGVPLDDVAEKLSGASGAPHRFGRQHTGDRLALLPAMYRMLAAHLGLNHMLGKANDQGLAPRLLNGGGKKLRTGLDLVAREGVRGLATLEVESAQPPGS
jgi:hypothetical protein